MLSVIAEAPASIVRFMSSNEIREGARVRVRAEDGDLGAGTVKRIVEGRKVRGSQVQPGIIELQLDAGRVIEVTQNQIDLLDE